MLFIRLMLASLVMCLFTGCLSSGVVDRARNPRRIGVPDSVERIESAVITSDHRLVIHALGRLTNSPQMSKFTVVFHLAEITATNLDHATGARSLSFHSLRVPRTSITDGWAVTGQSSNESNAVAVGDPIVVKDWSDYWEKIGAAKPSPNLQQTIFSITFSNNKPKKDWDVGPLQFVLIDPTRDEPLILLKIELMVIEQPANKANYLLLPITLPLDAATLPLLLPLLIIFHPGMC